MSDAWKGQLQMIDGDIAGALNMCGSPPQEMLRICRCACANWGLQLLHHPDYRPGIALSGEQWGSPLDALQSWQKALRYWEERCKENADAV